MNEKRLEDGWFLYRLVLFYREQGKLGDVNFHTAPDASNRRNIEKLCEAATGFLSTVPPKWVHHVCSVKGCRKGFAVVDGNEKVNRTMCAAPKSKVYIDEQKIYMTQCCPQSPASGGKSNLPVPHPSHPIPEKSKVGTLPDNDCPDVLVGCKKANAVTKFHDRTAGLLALVRPCGVIVSTCEMYT